jgi:hypothetical protein
MELNIPQPFTKPFGDASMVNRVDLGYESATINGKQHLLPQRWGQLFDETLNTYKTSIRGIEATVYEPATATTRYRGEVWNLKGASNAFTVTSGYLEILVVSGALHVVKNGSNLIIKEGLKVSFKPGETGSLQAITPCASMVVKNEQATLGHALNLPERRLFAPVTDEDVDFCRRVLEIPTRRDWGYRPSETTSAGYWKHKYASKQ